MHAVWTIGQVTNRELRPILAIAVGQNAVGRCRPVQAYYRRGGYVNGPDRLNIDGLPCRITHLDFKVTPLLIPIQPVSADEIRRTWKACVVTVSSDPEPIRHETLTVPSCAADRRMIAEPSNLRLPLRQTA